MNEVLIALRNISFGYEPDNMVLQNAKLEIRRGERIALVGRNGAGKTTLLHIIVGLLTEWQGELEAFGRIRQREKDFHEVRRRAALLFQEADDQLFCPTVIEDVAFGPLNLGLTCAAARRMAEESLEMVGLADYADRITHHLSAGEKKLVALAAILAMQPEVLLLDEPTTGLDEPAADRIAELLNKLDCAMLIVSHNRDFIARTTRRRITLSS